MNFIFDVTQNCENLSLSREFHWNGGFFSEDSDSLEISAIYNYKYYS